MIRLSDSEGGRSREAAQLPREPIGPSADEIKAGNEGQQYLAGCVGATCFCVLVIAVTICAVIRLARWALGW